MSAVEPETLAEVSEPAMDGSDLFTMPVCVTCNFFSAMPLSAHCVDCADYLGLLGGVR